MTASNHGHAESVLRRLEAHPCRECDGPREKYLRASAKCLACLRREYEEDGLDVAEFDRRIGQLIDEGVA